MPSLAAVFLTSLVAAGEAPPPPLNLAQAAAQVADGDLEGPALDRLRAAGKRGLWALDDLVKQETGERRARLIEAVGRFDLPEVEWSLLSSLKKRDAYTRAGAIRGLARYRQPSLYKHVYAAASSTSTPVRDAVVDALVLLGVRSDPRLAALAEAPSPEAREVSIRYWARVGNAINLERIVPRALSDPSPLVQVHALRLTREHRFRGHGPAIGRIARGPSPELALEAVSVLGVVATGDAVGQLAGLASERTSPEVIWRAALAELRRLGDSGLPSLIDALAKADPERRAAAVSAFTTSSPAERARFVAHLGDRDPGRAELAERALDVAGQAGIDSALDGLSVAHPAGRGPILAYVGRRAPEALGRRLVGWASKGTLRERLGAIQMIGIVADPRTLAELIPLTQDETAVIRAAAVLSLGPSTSPESGEALFAAARDPEPIVRANALRSLAQRERSPQVTRALLVALDDPDEEVRGAAARLLAPIRDPAIVHTLRARLFDASVRERVDMAAALAKSPLIEAIKLLVELAGHPEPEVRQAALAALAAG